MESKTNNDFSTVTETPESRASQEQIQRLYNRYKFASEYCNKKDVLEVACGAGLGIGYIARFAKKVVGGDIDDNNLDCAVKTYANRYNIEIRSLDAHDLQFRDNSFDVIILYEAIYYLSQPEKFVSEARRVLRDNGVLIICTANKDWSGFNPSPYSQRCFSASELFELLKEDGFIDIKLYGDCPATASTIKDKIISTIKKKAVTLHLIPKTMKGKELFKRVFMGKLVPLPPEIKDGMAEYTPPVPIPDNVPNLDYKVIFAVARV